MSKNTNTDIDINSEKVVEVLDDMPLWSAPFGQLLLENIQYRKNISVLDIGFGLGFPLTELAMRLGNSSTVYGIDPWGEGIERTKRKIEVYEINNVEILKGRAEEVPLEDESIDLITSNNGINNVEDLDKVLLECSRMLKKDGQFVQTVNLDTSLIEFYEIMEHVLVQEKMLEEVKRMKEHIYHKRKPLNVFLKMLEENNFKIEKVEHREFDYRFVDGTSLLEHFFIRLAFLQSWMEIVTEDKQEFIFDKIESELNKKAQKEGFLKLTIPFVMIDCRKS